MSIIKHEKADDRRWQLKMHRKRLQRRSRRINRGGQGGAAK